MVGAGGMDLSPSHWENMRKSRTVKCSRKYHSNTWPRITRRFTEFLDKTDHN